MKKLFFLISILFFISCSEKELSTYDEMKSDKLMLESFTDNELKNLAKIVDFFEDQICTNLKINRIEEKVEECYSKFLKKDSIISTKGGLQDFINYEEQQNLYKILDSSFFSTFWIKSSATFFDNKKNDIKAESFFLKIFDDNGLTKYPSFIKKLSKKNSSIKKYFESIEVTNSFYNPSSSIYLTYFHNKHNKKDIKTRLIYAFHFLNINETSIRHQKKINEINSNNN